MAFGLNASSYINKVRYSNTKDLKKYLENPTLNREIEEIQNKKTMEDEYMMLGLRMINGINFEDFIKKFEEDPKKIYNKQIEKLKKENLIEVSNNNIKLSKKGIDLANLVWEEFI